MNNSLTYKPFGLPRVGRLAGVAVAAAGVWLGAEASCTDWLVASIRVDWSPLTSVTSVTFVTSADPAGVMLAWMGGKRSEFLHR